MWSTLALVLSAIFLSALGSPSFPTFDEMKGKPYNVSYDNRALTLDGEHVLFISGAVHPPRGSPEDWDSWIALAKKNNINMLQVYIFWNFHEEEEGVFNFEGRGNLTLFMQKAAASGLFVNLRIGPYVCAEWTYGGLPAWLGLKPGVAFRQTNAVWQPAMEAWFNVIIDRMAKGSFFASQGGPIVLVQVENELPSTDKPYVEWCGTMAHAALAKAGVDVPITMCNGQTADDTINTCNGNDCSSFLEHHGQNGKVLVSQPGLWTENEGGFQTWGGAPPPGKEPYFWGRSIGDQSLSVMKWFARGGSHMNYYMWVGGNQFGRWTGDAITTMYAVDAMVCPDGLPHEPKFSQMAAMHSAIAKAAHIIAGDTAQLDRGKDVGGGAVAYIYGGERAGVAFIECLSGCAGGRPRVVKLNGHTFTLPTSESSSLVDLKTGEVLFNTVTDHRASSLEHRELASVPTPFAHAGWKQWREPVLAKNVPGGTYPSNCSFTQSSPVEQTVFTMCLSPDLDDAGARSKRSTYALYETTLPSSHPSKLSVGTNQATTLFAFVDGVLVAHAEDLSHNRGSPITLDLDLSAGHDDNSAPRTVTILSEEMGYANYGFKSQLTKGISGKVALDGADITSNGWHMRGGLAGEHLALFTDEGAKKVTWTPISSDAGGATWYKTAFTTPASVASGDAKLLINATGLNRGRLWVNGHDVGRYYLDPRNKPVGCIGSDSGPNPKCSYNTSAPFTGSQCYGLQALHAGDASAGACADACCARKQPTWQWAAKKDANGDEPGCWCGRCSSDFTPNPSWVGGHDTGSTSSCATQTLYYVPKEWLSSSDNSLVLFEGGGLEAPGDINEVGLTVAAMHSQDREAIDFQNLHSCAF